MSGTPATYDPKGPAAYAGAGNALSAVGEVLQGTGPAQYRAAGQILEAIGTLMGAQAQTWSDTLDGASAAAVAGGIIASVAAAYALPFSAIVGSAYAPALILLAANPVAAGILSAAFAFGVGMVAWEVGSFIGEELADLLADILSDPLVVDLDGDGIELVSLTNSGTTFDLDGDGVAERTGWVSPQDGLLVQDSNGNGVVDGVAELFGSANVDGFDELRTLDANGDGRIDANDPAFAQLRVWRDLNSDGQSTPDEMLTLAQAGIASFNLAASQVNQDVDGNVIARTGSYTRADGTSRGMASVNFALDEITPAIPEGADLGDLVTLPNLSGQLGLPDLRTAMFSDPTLRAMVEDLTYGNHDFDTFAEFREGGFLEVLYRWAGIDPSEPLEPGDQPYYIQLLSAFMGSPFEDLNPHQVERLSEIWDSFVGQLGTAFLVQAAGLPAIQPFYQMQDALAALSPSDPGFAEALSTILSNAVAASDAAQPAYDYLDLFAQLDINLATGAVTGNFDAFLEEFLEYQPPYDPGLAFLFIGSNLPPQPSPWLEWYMEQGTLLYTVAGMMGFGPDYVDNATGWGWLKEGAALVEGTNSDESINVISPGNQAIFGYDGNDELRGNDGNDRLIGGDGNDHLLGGTGSDMYVYASGDDLDRITEQEGADDTIYFSNELNRDALVVTRVAGTNDLLLHFGDPTKGIVLTNQWTSPGGAVDHFNFGPEGTLHAGDISSIYLATLARAGADTITGSWASERLIGLDGNDTLSGADGSDTLDGANGNDTLSGGNGNDDLLGGSGDDLLYGEGNDDRLEGGAGNDRMEGGGSADTYVYNLGDGDDVIFDYGGWDSQSSDTLSLGSGITTSNVRLSRVAGDSSDIRVSFTDQSGSLLIDAQGWLDAGIEFFRFADGTVWNHAQIMARYVADQQTEGDDLVWGSYLNDSFANSAGNDRMEGGGGNDTYVYNLGDGEDVIFDHGGWDSQTSDTLILGAGITTSNVLLSRVASDGSDIRISFAGQAGSILLDAQGWADAGIESFQFADGTVWNLSQIMARYVADQQTAGDDTIWGSYLNDSFVNGAGNDRMEGSGGNDTYAYNLGDGDDVIFDHGGWDHESSDRLVFGQGITISNILLSRVADNWNAVRISFTDQSGSILLDAQGWRDAGIESFQFADGTVWNLSQITARYVADQQTAGDNIIWGSYFNDSFVNGAGNDRMEGSGGNDTYTYNLGNGDDVIFDHGGWDHESSDRLAFGEGITVNDLIVSRVSEDSSDLRITFKNDPGSITIDHQTWWDGGIEVFAFADGTTLSHAAMDAMIVPATNGNNVLSGTAANDSIWALEGSDSLSGLAGDDLLFGQDGADQLYGGEGNDILEGGIGNDILDGGIGIDTLVGGADADVFLFRSGDSGSGEFADWIADFLSGTDRIDLSALDAQPSVQGDQAFAFLGTDPFTQQEGQLRYQLEGSNARLQADFNGDGAADFEMVLAGAGPVMHPDLIL